MDTSTLEELQRTRTELDLRVNSLQLAMNNLRDEMNLFDQDDEDEEVDDNQQHVGSRRPNGSTNTQATEEGQQRIDRRLPNTAELDTSAGLSVLSSVPSRDQRPFDPVRLRRGQVSLINSSMASSDVELLVATELRPPPSAEELDRSYRNFIQDRLVLSPLPGLSSTTDAGTPHSSSPSLPSAPFTSNGPNMNRSQLYSSHIQPRRLLRSHSGIGSDPTSDYSPSNPTLRLSSSILAPASSFTTRRNLINQLPNGGFALEAQSAEEILVRVDETATDLLDVRNSLQERSQSIRDLDGVPRMGALNETLRNGVDLIDQLAGRLGVVRNRLVGLTPGRRIESTSSVHVGVLPAPPRSFSIRPPQLRRGEFPRLELTPPSSSNEFNGMNRRLDEDEALFSASPDPIHSVPPVLTSRSDTFSDWVTSRGMPASASTAIYAYSPFTSENPTTTSITPSAIATTGVHTSSPLSSPVSLSGDLIRSPNRHRLLFNSNMAYAAPSSTAAASDRTTTMDPAAQLQEVRDRNNYMWRGGDDGMSFGEEIGGLTRSGWAERVIGGLGRRARQDRGGRRNRPWDLDGHGVSERGEEDWPEMTEADHLAGGDEHNPPESYNFDAPRDLSRMNLFVQSASENSALTVSLPNQTLRRELLLSGQAILPTTSGQEDQAFSTQPQTSPPPTLSSSRSLYSATPSSDSSAMRTSNHPVRLPTRRFEIHSFPNRSSIDPPNPLIVADRIQEDILLCEHRRIAAAAEAQRKKEEDEKKAATEIIDWMHCEIEYGDESEEEWVVRPGPVDLPGLWAESSSAMGPRHRKLKLEERGMKRSGEEMRRERESPGSQVRKAIMYIPTLLSSLALSLYTAMPSYKSDYNFR